jgi:hypothetical protein
MFSGSRLGGRRSRLEEESENGGLQHQQQPGEEGGEIPGSCWTEMDRANQQIQLMQMQLQFERQRREVHAERNRRLLGKLRDSRALEELNSAMVINSSLSSSPSCDPLLLDISQAFVLFYSLKITCTTPPTTPSPLRFPSILLDKLSFNVHCVINVRWQTH